MKLFAIFTLLFTLFTLIFCENDELKIATNGYYSVGSFLYNFFVVYVVRNALVIAVYYFYFQLQNPNVFKIYALVSVGFPIACNFLNSFLSLFYPFTYANGSVFRTRLFLHTDLFTFYGIDSMLDKTLYEGDLLTKLLPVWTLLAELSPWILQVVFGFFWMVFHGLHLFEIFEIDPLIAIPVEMIPIDSVKAVMEKYVTYLTNAKAFAPHVKGWKIAITVLNWISLLKDGTGEWSIFHSFYTTGAPAILPKNPVKEIDGTKEENEDESEDEDSEEGEKVVNKPQRSKMNLPSKRSDKKEGPVKGSEKKETSPDQSNKKEPVLDKKEPVLDKKEPVLDKKEPVLDKKETNSEKVETNSEKEGNVPDKKERESEKTSAEQKDISTASKQETTSASNENASVPSSENGSSSTAVDETTQDEPGSITSYVGREEVTENGNDNTSSNTSNPTSDQEPTEKNGSSTDGESPSKSSSDTSSNNGSTEESTEDASKGGDSTSTTIESGSDYESKYGKKGKDGRATGAKGRVRKSAASHLYVSLGAIFAAAIMLL